MQCRVESCYVAIAGSCIAVLYRVESCIDMSCNVTFIEDSIATSKDFFVIIVFYLFSFSG